jgi:hypothetical protein
MPSLLNSEKEEFKKSALYSIDIIQTVANIRPVISQDKIYLIYELSFLRIFLAWEAFCEKTFLLYMLGEQTDTGYSPYRYVAPTDNTHAYNLVKTKKDFFDFSNHTGVIERAELFFQNGEPYRNILRTKNSELSDIKTIRNAIAHISKDSQDKFINMVTHNLGSFPFVMTPGQFLYTAFKKTNISYISIYKNMLESICDIIVP